MGRASRRKAEKRAEKSQNHPTRFIERAANEVAGMVEAGDLQWDGEGYFFIDDEGQEWPVTLGVR